MTLTRSRGAACLLLALVVLLVPAASAMPAAARTATPAASEATAGLPDPTGRYAVGTTRLHLSLWYPALLPFGEPAQYMTPAESKAIVEMRDVQLPPGVPATAGAGSAPMRTSAKVIAGRARDVSFVIDVRNRVQAATVGPPPGPRGHARPSSRGIRTPLRPRTPAAMPWAQARVALTLDYVYDD